MIRPDINSLEDYRAHFRNVIDKLDARSAFRLSVLGLQRIQTEYHEAVWVGLSEDEQSRLRQILAVLQKYADDGSIPVLDEVLSMRRSLRSLAPEDDASLLGDVSPETVEFLSAIESALSGVHQTQSYAQRVLENLLNLADFRTQGREGYTLSTMFIDPGIVAEINIQREMIEEAQIVGR